MMRYSILLSATILLTALTSQPAQASSIPKAEVEHSSIGFGIGPSLAGDFKLAPQVSLGASFGLPFLVDGFGNTPNSRYDVRVVYRFLQQGGFSLSGILGVWGNINFANMAVSRWAGLELGLGLAYQFTPQLTGRLNLVGGYFFNGGVAVFGFRDYYPPAGGFELAYQFNPNIEGSIGYNGQGDILGLRFRI